MLSAEHGELLASTSHQLHGCHWCLKTNTLGRQATNCMSRAECARHASRKTTRRKQQRAGLRVLLHAARSYIELNEQEQFTQPSGNMLYLTAKLRGVARSVALEDVATFALCTWSASKGSIPPSSWLVEVWRGPQTFASGQYIAFQKPAVSLLRQEQQSCPLHSKSGAWEDSQEFRLCEFVCTGFARFLALGMRGSRV